MSGVGAGLVAILFLLVSPALALATPIGFVLGNGGTTLLRLGDVNGNAPPSSVGITDATGTSIALTDIDFELETGTLYGVSAATDSVYSLDLHTGLATFRASLPAPSSASVLAADWNNSIDRLRVVDTDAQNFVFNQDADTVTQFTPLSYAPGDPNEGVAPQVFANAYRDAVPGLPPQGGMQLGIDAATDALVTVANNAGTLATVGELGFDVTTQGGFDIYSTPDGAGGFDDIAYALLTNGETGVTALFQLALAADGSGIVALTLLRSFGSDADVRGLAVIDSGALAPVPLPAPLLTLAAALACLGGLRGLRRPARERPQVTTMA